MDAPSPASTLTPIPSSAGLSPLHPSTPLPLPSSSTSSFLTFRATITSSLEFLASTLQDRRTASDPVQQDEMRTMVDRCVHDAGWTSRDSLPAGEGYKVDVQAASVARAIEQVVNQAADYPLGDQAAFVHLEDVLDLMLTMADAGYIDETLPLNIVSGLMELRPIADCDSLFGWIEGRVERVTKGMEYQRGRGPILLRLLNDLLRRLPRSQSSPVILSGRILMLLSSVYPLGEKSGVNLRGNFNVAKSGGLGRGVVWEKEEEKEKEQAKGEEVEISKGEEERKEGKKEESAGGKLEVEEGEEEEPVQKKKKEGEGNPAQDNPSAFYKTFWSLQSFFTNPHLLFAPQSSTPTTSPSTSASTPPFETLRTGLTQTLTAFKAATKREKELTGSKDRDREKEKGEKGEGEGIKGEVEMLNGAEDEGKMEEYFFPKFLTSRNLLDLELSSPQFRLQLLIQTLILLQYLLSLTPSGRARAQALPVTNAVVFPPHVLGDENEKWIREVRKGVWAEMDSMEGGRELRRAVRGVLEREENWTDWKLRSCVPFIRLPTVPPAEQAQKARESMRILSMRVKAFPHKLGTPQLAKAWEKNVTSLEACPPESASEDLETLLRDHRLEQNRIKQQEGLLARAQAGSAKRREIEVGLEERRTRLSSLEWRAIRLASTTHLSLFSQIGSGSLTLLSSLLSDQARAREEVEEATREGREVGEEVKGVLRGEGYESDESVLGVGREEREREKEKESKEKEQKDKDEKEKAEEERKAEEAKEKEKAEQQREREAGTPEPKKEVTEAVQEKEKKDEKKDEKKKASRGDDKMQQDEPGTPPPRSADDKLVPVKLPQPLPKSPGTPKRPRPEDGDTEMKDGSESGAKEAKKARRE